MNERMRRPENREGVSGSGDADGSADSLTAIRASADELVEASRDAIDLLLSADSEQFHASNVQTSAQ